MALLAFLPALVIAYVLTMRVVCPKPNSFLLKFALFETYFEYSSHFLINEAGLMIDEGDRLPRIAWSGIGGVFETKDYMGFCCRGLVNTIPFDRIGDGQKPVYLRRAEPGNPQRKVTRPRKPSSRKPMTPA